MGAEPLAAQLLYGAGEPVAGDLGLLSVRALLECGIGYVVTGWTERPTPVDAAIADLRGPVLERAGIRLRRLRDLGSVASVVTSAGVGVPEGSPLPRGVVVWNGVAGMAPTLEQFCGLEVPAPVVGICFDRDVCRAAGATVIDPEPTAEGFMHGLEQGLALSAGLGRPVLLLVRPRLLGMRGVVVARDRMTVAQAAVQDAEVPRGLEPAALSEHLGLVDVRIPRPAVSAVVCGTPVERAVRRSLATIEASLREVLPAGDAASLLPGTLVSACTQASLDRDRIEQLRALDAVLVLDGADTALHRSVAAVPGVERVRVDLDRVTGDRLLAALAAWLRDTAAVEAFGPRVQAQLDALVRSTRPVRPELGPDRLLRRDASPLRELPETVAAALVLVQAEVGIPARLDPAWRTWRTEAGGFLTVVSASQLAAQGPACMPPGTPAGVVVVTGGGDVSQAAGALGASMEAVDGSDPRALAAAIARALTAPLGAPHVIVGIPSATPIDLTAEPGFDADLLGSDRLSLAALPPGAIGLYERHHELDRGPVPGLADPAAAATGLRASASLSPAWYELRARRRPDAFGRRLWNLRRRVLRAVAGVEA